MADDRQFLDIDGAGLPYDVDAEQAVIGSILIDPSFGENTHRYGVCLLKADAPQDSL